MGIFDNLLGNKKDDLSINEEIERLRSRLADLESRASASQATPQSEVPEQPSVTPSPEEPEPEPQPEPNEGDGVIYDVWGGRVDETYKGIVIRNGKKYLQR